jgi:cytochrome P450
MRNVAPVVWSDSHDGFWIATTHDAVRRLAISGGDYVSVEVFEDENGVRKGGMGIPPRDYSGDAPRFVPGEAEGEEHDMYRLALNPMFSKQKVAEARPMIERHVDQAIDLILAGNGEFDIIHDLVDPVLCGIALEHLGLSTDDPPQFFDDLRTVNITDKRAAFDAAWQVLVDTVAARRVESRDDVVSHLVNWAETDFTDEQVQSMVFNVILGAHGTTMLLASQVYLFLDQNPDVRARLRENPDDLPGAVEESLRLFIVAHAVCRTVMQDIPVEGYTLQKGERLMLNLAAANHDPEKYPRPYDFDLERGARQHVGMGYGTHFCLGAHLAKSIMVTMLRESLGRLGDFTIDQSRVEKTVARITSYTAIPARLNAVTTAS